MPSAHHYTHHSPWRTSRPSPAPSTFRMKHDLVGHTTERPSVILRVLQEEIQPVEGV
ncbi:uncharacterized protein STEHIDRAFT_122901 [Stereum hirsutum FP-91666 SS1]|uniref:uncharacterized protein n=1 Tax=Stereum hirsutum (strain FP-91666) TaxID=721885 RepID=UPI000444A6AE|nr:uncharacterized protein STEHIDRAFT_122901 [Stereum hirsutum FP-91666 SS1]EIM84979.1 hypothetical protein STEHIDRAFT_122901 [Stereum hirsutum FP-91666 SS1]